MGYVKKNFGGLFLLLAESFLFLIGIWAMMQDVTFLSTKKEANAEVIKLEKLPLPDPYKITVKYYNEYEHTNIVSYVDNIDGIYGKMLPPIKSHINIFYKKSLPKVIYLVDYKYPNNGNIILYIVFLLILVVAIIFQFIALKDSNVVSEDTTQ